MRSRILRAAAVTVAVAGSTLAWQTAQAFDIHYSGTATGIKGTLNAASANKSILVAEVLMACTGSAREETVSAVSNPQPLGVSAKSVHVFTQGINHVSAANADIEQFNMNLSDGFKVDATAIQSHAEASCDEATRAVKTAGGADVGSLFINGQGQTMTGNPNQTFEVPGLGKVVVNEQQQVSSKELIVTAVHVYVSDPSYPASGDIIFARSRAKVTCTK
jgi:hypothetical protein